MCIRKTLITARAIQRFILGTYVKFEENVPSWFPELIC
jgi:hypothetical protein